MTVNATWQPTRPLDVLTAISMSCVEPIRTGPQTASAGWTGGGFGLAVVGLGFAVVGVGFGVGLADVGFGLAVDVDGLGTEDDGDGGLDGEGCGAELVDVVELLVPGVAVSVPPEHPVIPSIDATVATVIRRSLTRPSRLPWCSTVTGMSAALRLHRAAMPARSRPGPNNGLVPPGRTGFGLGSPGALVRPHPQAQEAPWRPPSSRAGRAAP